MITDVNYAFLDLKPNSDGLFVPVLSDPWADTDKPFDNTIGKVNVNGNFGEFLKLRQSGAKFEFGLSIGGWTYSKHFSEAMRTQQSRLVFVNAIVDLVTKWKDLVDRIDL